MIGLISVNYKNSPVEIREQIHVALDEISILNSYIKKNMLLQGLFIISTCNRTEIYFNYNQKNYSKNNIFHKIISCLIKFKKVSEGLSPYIEKKIDKQVFTHIFSLASGLESMIIGEYQIVEQIKSTYKVCKKNNMLSSILDRMIQKSLNASKLIRTKTKIDKGAVSVSYAAVEKISNIYNKKSISIINIGIGNTGQLTLESLIKKKYRNIEILNRTISKSKQIAEKFNLKYQPIECIYNLMTSCDVMIFSTSSRKKLITTKETKKALNSRKKPLLMIDLSMPTNVPKDINTIDVINLVNIDGLKDEVNKNYLKRKREIKSANKMINKLVDEFIIWVKNKEIRNIINQFNKEFDQNILSINNNASQKILENYKQNIIENIKAIEFTKDQNPISVINSILLKK
tara:strand:- start:8754 stop:9959 length:1206 start_codon:yes stop_codon:yes gene_type:complete